MLTIAPPIAVRPAPSAGPYVLLVDDHEPSLRRLHEVVAQSGHRCVSTCSPGEAVRCCDARRPRVVVTDLAMPNLDGRGLACWLRSRFPSVPIVLMTGQDLDAGMLRGLRPSFAEILPKPVDIERLLGLLDRLMPPAGNRDGTPGRP